VKAAIAQLVAETGVPQEDLVRLVESANVGKTERRPLMEQAAQQHARSQLSQDRWLTESSSEVSSDRCSDQEDRQLSEHNRDGLNHVLWFLSCSTIRFGEGENALSDGAPDEIFPGGVTNGVLTGPTGCTQADEVSMSRFLFPPVLLPACEDGLPVIAEGSVDDSVTVQLTAMGERLDTQGAEVAALQSENTVLRRELGQLGERLSAMDDDAFADLELSTTSLSLTDLSAYVTVDTANTLIQSGGGATDDSGSPASGEYSAIGDGFENTATGSMSVVAGGWNNTASGSLSIVSGGWSNVASHYSSTVSGGGVHATAGSGDYVD
jgi:hypothetical protein